MTKRHQRLRREEREGESVRWAAVLRAIVLGGAVALVVMGAMVPSESAISEGAHAPMIAGWCLLLVVWAASMLLDPQRTMQIGWTECAGVALVGWHSVAALVSLGQTNGRHAMNAHWLILSYGIAAFLLRQTVRTGQQARSVFAAMVWLATLLASLGLFQYFYSMPKLRADFEREPEKFLQDNDVATAADSVERRHFQDRVQSKEPLATFALTNSLAGVLGPWLVGVLGLGAVCLRDHRQRLLLLAVGVTAGVMATCLVLTKSRTGYLAVAAGLVLLGIYGRGAGARWRLDWRIPTGLAAAATVIGLMAVYFGGLDVQVLSEAPKSVLYRVEYWRATARVIAQYPLFGCGPGNFQEAYAAFQLPQASETVKDPHNFLLEVWASAGTPAMLLLLAVMVGFVVDVTRSHAKAVQDAVHPHPNPLPEGERIVAPAKWIVFGGVVAGLVLGPWIASALGFGNERMTPTAAIWLLGIAWLAAAWWLLDAWVADGELPLAIVVIPQIVLLINLLAAGAIVFPTVMATVLVLAPVALVLREMQGLGQSLARREHRPPEPLHLEPRHSEPRHSVELSQSAAAVVTLAAAAVAVACLYTEYYPVLNGQLALSKAMLAMRQQRYHEAFNSVLAAARADSLAPEPWQLLGQMRLDQWQVSAEVKDWETFLETANTYRRLSPRHYLAWYVRGNWFLTAWRKGGRSEELDAAISAYRRASERFPGRAVYHAQLALALSFANDEAGARHEAERALELDEKMPHQEHRLARQHLFDPDLSKQPARLFQVESAEATARRLCGAVAASVD